jgi:uncharacterized protein (DUF2235 family)
MSKQILFCADGTWNGPGAPADNLDVDGAVQVDAEVRDNVTNVVKLFANLAGQVTAETQALHNETEKVLKSLSGDTVQIAKYMHGVGDSKNPVLRVLGGGFGAGVIARVVRGYTFISRHYQPGDSIHIIGFSRGAYTARALAGMIATVGLLDTRRYDANDKNKAYLRGFEAWIKCKGVVFTGKDHLSSLLTALTVFVSDLITRVALRDEDFVKNVRIRSVGVWDTVGSLGVPDYIQGQRRDLFSFVDLKLSDKVDRGFHAIALDERRLDFPVTRWAASPRVEEMWFVGAHSDVGGGYPAVESGLSDLALDWMTEKLSSVGAQFATPPIHPVDVSRFEQDFHTPWNKIPFNLGPVARVPAQGDAFHPSVKRRWQASRAYQDRWPKLF